MGDVVMSRAMTKYGDHSVHCEWQPRKSADYLFKHVKKGRAKYGELHKLPDGTVVYWAERKAEELVYTKNAWAIDKSTLMLLRCCGVKVIGIAVNNGDRWQISYEDFDLNKLDWDYSGHVGTAPGAKGRLGASQWFVEFKHWSFEKGKAEDIEKSMTIGKWR